MTIGLGTITQLTVDRHSRQDVALTKARRGRLPIRLLDEGTGQAAYYMVTRRAWLPQLRSAVHLLRLTLGPPAATNP